MTEALRRRLTAFRAAYYRIQILRGVLLTLGWSGLIFLLFALTEGIFWWEVPLRRFLWVLWVGGSGFLLGRWVLYPILQYGFRLRGYLSDEEAAKWIGRRLPEIRDKLLNALQLSYQDPEANAAVALAIEERMRQLSVLPWEASLPTEHLRRYGLLLVGVILFGAFLWIVSPTVFREGAHRFLRPNQAFARPLPYTLIVEGLQSFYRQGEALKLIFILRGKKLPDNLVISSERGPLSVEKQGIDRYILSLPQLRESFTLFIEANGELLRKIPIKVLQAPLVRDFQLVCIYPPYTKLRADTFTQTNLRVLRGSSIQLSFRIESDRDYTLSSAQLALKSEKNTWSGHLAVTSSGEYTIRIQDDFFQDSITIRVESYPDLHPSVQLFAEWFNPESWQQKLRMRLMDDFGFTRAVLWYRIAESSTPGRAQSQYRAIPLSISGEAIQERTFQQDWRSLGIQPGDKVEYYVEVWDNDAISGPKSSRSILYTLEPIDDPERQKVFASLQDSLFRELKALRREVEQLVSEKELSQISQKASQLSERFRQLRSELRSLERLAAEQQLYTEELLKQMQQLQKLLEATDPQKAEQLLMQMQQSDSLRFRQLQEELRQALEEWRQKLERLEALLPAYQQQRFLEQLMTKLSEMIEQQRQLSQLSDSLQRASEGLQKNLQAQTQELQRQVDSLRRQLNEGILRDSLGKAGEALHNASERMKEALEKLQQGGSPQPSQQKAAESLERALSAIDQGMQNSAAQEEAEDYEALRLLLKGILSLSFRQEQARKKAQESSNFTSTAQPLITEQTAIRRDYRQVHDTLFALAHRSPAVEEPILDLLREIDRYFQGITFTESELLIRRQQYILQGFNRLANLLTELLAQLEERQRERQQGGGACQRPFKVRRKSTSSQSSSSQGKQGQRPSPQPAQKNSPGLSPQQLQRRLNEALERALSPNPAAESPGGLTPEERARLSAQQELIRLRLQELMRQNPGDAGSLQSLIEEMQKAEKDILIGNITRERLMRQQAILTRLLEYERSQHERELDPSRESRTAQQFFQRTTGSYPTPNLKMAPSSPTPALWLYRPLYQRLIEEFFRQP
ncbi:MAG: hypothetical protein NZ989_01915 [Bacteroidia bacterium]|nr:hypothetical protein [Bacteroidia bacterium]MDW8056869.1 DUF4175 family protein [Bacteroidia bacterium]